MANLRRKAVIWNNVQTGVAGASAGAVVGAATNVTIFMQVNGATTITVEVGPGGSGAGRNDITGTDVWYPLFKDDFSAGFSFVFAGAGKAALDLSPLAAEHVRIVSSNDVLASAFVDSI